MANTKTKLIRIVDGIYRNESGTIRIFKRLKWRGVPAHWEVRFTNWHGCPIEKKLSTLAKVRHFVETGEMS